MRRSRQKTKKTKNGSPGEKERAKERRSILSCKERRGKRARCSPWEFQKESERWKRELNFIGRMQRKSRKKRGEKKKRRTRLSPESNYSSSWSVHTLQRTNIGKNRKKWRVKQASASDETAKHLLLTSRKSPSIQREDRQPEKQSIFLEVHTMKRKERERRVDSSFKQKSLSF